MRTLTPLPRQPVDDRMVECVSARAPDTTMDLPDLVRLVGRRRRLILVCVAVALALAVAYLLVTPPRFLATASILIEPNANGSLTADTAWARGAPDANVVENQLRLVLSDAVLRRVVEKEGLSTDPEFGPQPEGMVQHVLRVLGLRHPASTDPTAAATANLRRAIVTQRSERTFVIEVGVSALDPAKSTRLTDALARAFIQEEISSRVATADQQSREITTRLAALKARIEAAEGRVEDFKRQHALFDNNGRPLAEQQLADAERDLAQAHIRTLEAKARLDQITASLAAGRDASSLPDAMRSVSIERIRAQIADLVRQEANQRTTLGPRHPAFLETENQLNQARALLRAELRRLADGARNDYDVARANEAAQRKRVAELQAQTSDATAAMVKMRELQRDAEESHAIYDRFLKASGFVASDTIDTPTARMISAAIAPTGPSSPRRAAVLAIALAAGLGLGLGLALYGASRVTPPPAPRAVATVETPAPVPVERPDHWTNVDPAAYAEAARALRRDTPKAEAEPAAARDTIVPFAAEARQEAAAEAPPISDPPVPPAETLAAAPAIQGGDAEKPPIAAPKHEEAAAAPEAQPELAAPLTASENAAPLPSRFDIPSLAAEDEPTSLSALIRSSRSNPETMLPFMREVALRPNSEYSRTVRRLRRAIAGGNHTDPLIISVTSTARACGKSTLAANLAHSFADGGLRVLVLDADRRGAALSQALGMDGPQGTIRIVDAMRPVFALDGSWRAGRFLVSLALGRATERPSASMPGFAGLKALADVLIIDTQSGTRGPALGPDLAAHATLTLEPPLAKAQGAEAAFARLSITRGSSVASASAAARPDLADDAMPTSA